MEKENNLSLSYPFESYKFIIMDLTSDPTVPLVIEEKNTNNKPKYFLHDETIAWLKDNMEVSILTLPVKFSNHQSEFNKLNVKNSLDVHGVTISIKIGDQYICSAACNINIESVNSAIASLTRVNENMLIAMNRMQNEINMLNQVLKIKTDHEKKEYTPEEIRQGAFNNTEDSIISGRSENSNEDHSWIQSVDNSKKLQ